MKFGNQIDCPAIGQILRKMNYVSEGIKSCQTSIRNKMDAKPGQDGHILGRKSLSIPAFQTYHLKSDNFSQMPRNDRSK
jgi:hypothetical protein